jgi:hypothetical protein
MFQTGNIALGDIVFVLNEPIHTPLEGREIVDKLFSINPLYSRDVLTFSRGTQLVG